MLTKKSRVFTFGCSFTEFPWPTWADIVIKHAETEVSGVVGENWGRIGAGNLYIASRIWECHAKNKLTPDDYVFVCWSALNREDRYVDGAWQTPGLVNENIYKREFIEKYVDTTFYAMRDCALIKSTQLALTQLGVTNIHFSMVGLIQSNPWLPFLTPSTSDKVVKTHDLHFDCEPMMQVLGLEEQSERTAPSRVKTYWPGSQPLPEWHPTPEEHKKYLNTQVISKVDWLKNGLNESANKLVDDYTSKIKSFNGEPFELRPETLGWYQKSITPKW